MMMMLWVVESVGCKADREGRTAKGGRKGVGTNEGTETCCCCCYRRSRSDDRWLLRDCRAMPGGSSPRSKIKAVTKKKRDTMLSHCKSKGKSRGTVPPTVRSFQTTRREQERERERERKQGATNHDDPTSPRMTPFCIRQSTVFSHEENGMFRMTDRPSVPNGRNPHE